MRSIVFIGLNAEDMKILLKAISEINYEYYGFTLKLQMSKSTSMAITTRNNIPVCPSNPDGIPMLSMLYGIEVEENNSMETGYVKVYTVE